MDDEEIASVSSEEVRQAQRKMKNRKSVGLDNIPVEVLREYLIRTLNRGIKSMSHTVKIWLRGIDRRLRDILNICEEQFGFMPGKETTDAIYVHRLLMEKYREGQKELHCIFIDLVKPYHRVPREEVWNCLRQKGVTEKYVKLIQTVYRGACTQL
ncbi:uncharacterized protein LOC119596720 [Penaeus monodon]|uniref:uncharacterized protein LOC119596720 n=1 Tax=Penaeus monodon TaxID=6687 RepID=UPI0018A76B63|nr:uncharacterized protein LOC119596720 [Penaeus monodon]